MTTSTGTVCYDADFYPYGGERVVTNTCPQNYKFTGKERDAETNNDDFGARYYSSQFGRWISPDWSAIPAPVPYANLTNPQTLNLYAMVHDNPEAFADLDGHGAIAMSSQGNTIAEACGTPGACDLGPQQQQQAQQPPTLSLSGSVTSSSVDSNGNPVVQSPSFLQIEIKSASPLSPGTYQVNISVTKDTDGKDNGQAVKAAQITAKEVDDTVKGVTAKVGTQVIPSTEARLVVGISAKNGDFHYEGNANVNVIVTGPNGTKGGFSIPVDLQRGNPSSPSVVGVSGGRTTFVVPPS